MMDVRRGEKNNESRSVASRINKKLKKIRD